MKKVLVIGGSGFVGSHVVEALIEAGHRVTVFDRLRSDHIHPSAGFIQGEITDAEGVESAVQGHSIVYNFAGIADIGEASKRPLEVAKVNILGNVHVLEACRKNGVERIVYASSVYVFSDTGSFYKCGKRTCEEYLMEYQRQFGLNFTILRYGTLYGNRSDESNSIHRYLKQALFEGRIVYLGDEDFVREYIHVEDAARLSVEILKKEFLNEFVILTGPSSINVKELLGMIQEMLGGKIRIEYRDPPEYHYKITTYSFNPKLGKKLVSRTYYDMGQGLLKCLQELHERYVLGKEAAKVQP